MRLPQKQVTFSSDSQHPYEKPSVVACAYDLSAGKRETGD